MAAQESPSTDPKDQQSLLASELFSVAGKVAFVTGGSRGIGLMIAEAFVSNGAKVYISSRKAEVCQQTAEKLNRFGSCTAIPADLSTEQGRTVVVDFLSAHEDQLHILVNNAGAAWGAPYAEYPESGYDKVMDINVKAPFMLTRDLVPLLSKGASATDPARVINIGSIDGLRVPSVENYAYGPSKAAIHHLTRVLAVELGRQAITVNAIAPGPFESKMTEWLLEQHGERIKQRCPLGRISEPSDIAGLALFLASRAGAYMNGAVIPLDGGIHIA
ncbi:SDR family oxidoreductase [Chloroflexi bacterium TSY]|nr:SDR family oxidoreductase [Chloroflexi bacterium TSY]